tara:strand:+ start:13717 stop:15735 length:2019 start_codon:yes stop_codon:yes gene_type:complete
MTNTNSSYWLSDWDDDDIITETFNDVEKKSHNLYKLASSKRAISNFVNIVTNESIPVKFNTRGNSYTDGKTVVIGANIVESKDFDVAVGLALHEGSHIKLSDFSLLADIYSLVPKYVVDGAIKKGITNSISIIKDLWNYVEDRRIDNFVFNSAPGYRDYYRAMYDKYFNDKLIDKALLSDEYTTEDVDSYMFRIINLHNKNTDLSKLKGLREVYKLVGLNTISRLKSSDDTFNVALSMFQVILLNLNTVDTTDGESESKTLSDDEFQDILDNMDGSTDMSGDSDSQPSDIPSMESDADGGEPSEESKSDDGKKSKVELTDRQKELLKKKIEKQRNFMDGDITKKAVTKKDQETIEALNESGSEVTTVGSGVENGWGSISKGIECIVVKKLTQNLLENEAFPMTTRNWNDGGISSHYQEEISKGIRMGTILGKKLQVRGEDRTTVFNRQKVGRIDKRMISSLGFGNENVFQFTETDSYKKANLHVSIDASGSMGGEKWSNTLINVVSLCKAVDMIQNLNIQVTFRTTSSNTPYIVMAYDSKVDKFSKVKKMFPTLCAGGTTPEGLCFEAIMKNFMGSTNDMDSYFLNLSDGEPYFYGKNFYYAGRVAAEHTKKQVKKMEGIGIKTLSYFVESGYNDGECSRLFKTMYGSGASMIDVTNLSQITKTMNKLFLQK